MSLNKRITCTSISFVEFTISKSRSPPFKIFERFYICDTEYEIYCIFRWFNSYALLYYFTITGRTENYFNREVLVFPKMGSTGCFPRKFTTFMNLMLYFKKYNIMMSPHTVTKDDVILTPFGVPKKINQVIFV